MRPYLRPVGATLAATLCLAATATHAQSRFTEGHPILGQAQAFDPFGMRVAVLPDVNGDGIEDFALGSLSLPESGGVTVHSGASGAELRRLTPIDSPTLYPNAVADAGDVDFDGTNDIAVGSGGAAFDQTRGAVRWYSGEDGHLIGTLAGTTGGERFGVSIVAIGDFDGDGAGDLAVGATKYLGRGRVYIASGGTRTVIRSIEAPAGARDFGTSLQRLGDIDGDREDDIGIGAPSIDTAGPRFAYTWSPRGDAPIATVQGAADSPTFGSRVTPAGDFNGDGRADFGVFDSTAGGTIRDGGPGRAQVFDGATGAQLLVRMGRNASSELGRGGGIADIDGDGNFELFIGAKEGGATNAGSLSIVGGPDGSERAHYTNTIARDRLFNDTQALGDVNGDGRLDFIATTFGSDSSSTFVVGGAVSRGAALAPIVGGHTGLWYDPSHAGEGFVLEVYADGRATVYWFTYLRGGAQRYLVGTGRIVGPRLVFDELYDTSGGRLGGAFEPSAISLRDRGQLVLMFDGCDSGYAEYTVDGDRWRQRIARLSRVPGTSCTQNAAARADFTGSWYDAAHPGEGWIVTQVGDGAAQVFWFTYGDDGSQQWLFGGATQRDGELVVDRLFRPTGGRFGRYFRPEEVAVNEWGTLVMRFTGCNSASVSWTHAGANGASANVTRLSNTAAVTCQRN